MILDSDLLFGPPCICLHTVALTVNDVLKTALFLHQDGMTVSVFTEIWSFIVILKASSITSHMSRADIRPFRRCDVKVCCQETTYIFG